MSTHLGPRLARAPMHLFWLLDVSGSMSVGGKIESLNAAMGQAVAAVRSAAQENPGVQVLVRVLAFADDAAWHVDAPTDIEEFGWSDIAVVERGTTELGLAIARVTEAIHEVSQTGRGLPPAIVLVSDGRPTDLKEPSFGRSLRGLDAEPWGRKSSRMAIGIGADADMAALQRFIGHDEIPPLHASNAEELSRYLRWASTVVVDDRSRPTGTWSDAAATPARPSAAPPPVGVPRSDVPPPPVGVPRSDVPPPPVGVPRSDVPPPPVGVPRSDVPPAGPASPPPVIEPTNPIW